MKCYGVEETTMVPCNSTRESVVCPKPRRFGDHARNLRHHPNNHLERSDLKAGAELLDIILSKGNGLERSPNHIASSPPFFCGSPPSRVSNPIIQDKHFGSESIYLFSPATSLSASPSSSARKGGCVRVAFGQKPAAVRIEGFNCLNRDRQNCSISAVA